jgi:hypothetical protein
MTLAPFSVGGREKRLKGRAGMGCEEPGEAVYLCLGGDGEVEAGKKELAE